MTLHFLLEASGALHLHCCKEAGLLYTRGGFFQRAAKYGSHNSVKLSQFWALIGLEFVLRHPGGVEFTVTECFLRNTH